MRGQPAARDRGRPISVCRTSNAVIATVASMTSAMPGEHPVVIVYDLDGVITTRDSFTALIVEQLLRAPLRLLRALPVAATMLVSRREKHKRHAAARIAAIALAGMSNDDYTALATKFGTRIGDDPAWIGDWLETRIAWIDSQLAPEA